MAKVRQSYDEPVVVPWLGDRVVQPGEDVIVPDEDLVHYLEAGWRPADAATGKAAALVRNGRGFSGDLVIIDETDGGLEAQA